MTTTLETFLNNLLGMNYSKSDLRNLESNLWYAMEEDPEFAEMTMRELHAKIGEMEEASE